MSGRLAPTSQKVDSGVAEKDAGGRDGLNGAKRRERMNDARLLDLGDALAVKP